MTPLLAAHNGTFLNPFAAPQDHAVPKDLKALVVNAVHAVHKAHKVHAVNAVLRGNVDPADQKDSAVNAALKDPAANAANADLGDHAVNVEPLVNAALWVTPATGDLLARKALRECQALPELLENKALKAMPARKVQQVQPDNLEFKVQWGLKVKSAPKAKKVIPACKGQEAMPVLPVRVGKPDLWDLKVHVVNKAFQASRALEVKRAAKGIAAVLALAVHAANVDPAVLAVPVFAPL